jgi:hypothetical protein
MTKPVLKTDAKAFPIPTTKKAGLNLSVTLATEAAVWHEAGKGLLVDDVIIGLAKKNGLEKNLRQITTAMRDMSGHVTSKKKSKQRNVFIRSSVSEADYLALGGTLKPRSKTQAHGIFYAYEFNPTGKLRFKDAKLTYTTAKITKAAMRLKI